MANEQGKSLIWIYVLLALFIAALIYIAYDKVQDGKRNQELSNIEQLKSKVVSQEAQISELTKTLDSLTQDNIARPWIGGNITDDGLHYEVQIGAFKYFDLSKYSQNFYNLRGEEADGFDKYTLAKFRTYEEATNFKKDIRLMGVKDAFVVPKKDGVRINIAQALQEEGVVL